MREKLVKIPYYGSVALLAYMPFHIFLSQWLSTFTGGLEIWKGAKDVLTFLLALVAFALVTIYAKKVPKTYYALVGLSFIYGLVHVLVYFFNRDTSVQIAGLATVYNCRLFAYAIIGFSAALLTPGLMQARRLAKLVIGVSVVVCVLGLLQYYLPSDVLTHFGYSVERGAKPNFYIDNKPDLVRIMSTIREPNSLGVYLMVPILLLIAALGRKKVPKKLVYGLLMLHGLLLALTFSRSAALGLFIALIAYALYGSSQRVWVFAKKYAVMIFACCLLLLSITFMLRDQYLIQNALFHSDENTVAIQSSNDKHLSYALEGMRAIAERPFGHGPGTAGPVSMQNPGSGFVTENYFLQIGYEVGVVGLGVFLVLYGWFARRLWLERTTMARVLFASLVGLTVANLFLHTWANEAVALQWWLLAGAVFTSHLKSTKHRIHAP